MNLVRAKYVDTLVSRAREHVQKENFPLAWKLLEEAHVCSQPMLSSNLFVHWEMLKLARLESDYRELFGQMLRFLIAVPSIILRSYPEGNLGRSNVSMFKPMLIPAKLAAKIAELDKLEQKRIENGGIIEPHQRKHPITRR